MNEEKKRGKSEMEKGTEHYKRKKKEKKNKNIEKGLEKNEKENVLGLFFWWAQGSGTWSARDKKEGKSDHAQATPPALIKTYILAY